MLLKCRWQVQFALQKVQMASAICTWNGANPTASCPLNGANRSATCTWTIGVEVQFDPPEKSNHHTPSKPGNLTPSNGHLRTPQSEASNLGVVSPHLLGKII